MTTASRLACAAALLITLVLPALLADAVRAESAAPTVPRLAVLPFEIKDTSTEAIAPERRAAMLAKLTELVRAELAAAGLYDPVPGPAVEAAVAAADLHTYLRSCNGCERRIAARVSAERVMVGWVRKISRLVSSLVVRISEVGTGREVYLRGFDFRGDTDEAWAHAARYMVRALNRSRTGPSDSAVTPGLGG